MTDNDVPHNVFLLRI